MRDPRDVVQIGHVVSGRKKIGKMFAVVTVEDLVTLRDSVLVATEYEDGKVTLLIVRVPDNA